VDGARTTTTSLVQTLLCSRDPGRSVTLWPSRTCRAAPWAAAGWERYCTAV